MSAPATRRIEPEAHHPYVTRRIVALASDGRLPDVAHLDVEPTFGHVVRLTYGDGAVRIVLGNDLGCDQGAAIELARDKGHTKFLLRRLGIPCPDGREFVLPWWAEVIGPAQARRGNDELLTVDRAHDTVVGDLGYPVFVKPVAGSKGRLVRRVADRDELESALADLDRERSRVAVVEAVVDLPDHRIVTFDGELVAAYRRVPLHITGDGGSTVDELLAGARARFLVAGRDDRDAIIGAGHGQVARSLAERGLTSTSVLAEGQVVPLSDLSNLALGGTCDDLTDSIDRRWVELASTIARQFGLRLCGTDLACSDVTRADTEHSVLEINGTPGLDHFAASGEDQRQIVDDLYERIVGRSPG